MADVMPAADTQQIWRWLESVADPEIPVLSVIDLGIVRDVAWAGDELRVTITPTYSGCPAMDAIAQAIRDELNGRGIARVRLGTRLSPAWTTDWLSARGREALREFGIAPPVQQVGTRVIDISALRRARADERVACPRCGSPDTRQVSRFGSTACKAQYRCNACLEPFDYFKPH